MLSTKVGYGVNVQKKAIQRKESYFFDHYEPAQR